jgi:hypothetical protein
MSISGVVGLPMWCYVIARPAEERVTPHYISIFSASGEGGGCEEVITDDVVGPRTSIDECDNWWALQPARDQVRYGVRKILSSPGTGHSDEGIVI